MFPKGFAVCLTPLLAGVCVLTSALESRAEVKSRAPGRLAAKSAVATDLPALHPNLARGWRAEARFDADNVAAIDLFNGNLLFGIPIGQSYRMDSQLSYALELRYNSQIWDFSTVSGATQGKPMAYSNAGLGFDLSLGRLIAPGTANNPTGQWIYVSPDGGQHLFYSSLHHDTPDTADSGDTTQYTRDGSYLRLRPGSRAATTKRVEHGDGVMRTFTLANGEWRVTRIASQSSQGIDITYSTDGLTWTLADSFGRIAVVRLQSLTDSFGTAWRLIDRVELPAFGSQVATYVFSYSFASVGRACTDTRGGTETVPLLSAVTDPVGQTYQLEYTVNGSDCHDNGRLKRYQIAAGGSYGFDYGQYTFPSNDCVVQSPPAHFNIVSGVVQRRKLQPDGTVVGTWTYTPQVDAAAGGGCGFDGRRTVVVTPLGHRQVYHFAVGTDAPSAGGPALYGLPIAPARPHPTAPLYLTDEVYNCPAGGDCVLMRTRWAAWEQDQACGMTSGNCFDTNRRLARWQEVFEDDEPVAGVKRFKDIAQTVFDGLGNYRVRIQTSNFGRADSLATFRYTNADAGVYPPGSSSGGFGGPSSFTVPAIDQPWFLADYSYLRVTDDAGASLHTDACFSTQGWLLRSRRRTSAAAVSAHDVVTAWTWAGGEVSAEARLGGDLAALSTTEPLCTMTLPSGGLVTQRTYEYGALASEVALAAGQSPGYAHIDRDIDLNTGKVAVSRDSAGLATTFLYDLAGRTTWERPEEGAWTEFAYTLPTGASAWNAGPKVTHYERPNGGGTPLRTRYLLHDALDRLTGEWSSMPDNAITAQRFQYNAFDWRTAESTPYAAGSGATLYWKQYLGHDPLGRARIIRPPEGSVHDELYTYLGDRATTVERKTGSAFHVSGSTPICTEDTVTNLKLADGQGRIWYESVDEPAPAPGRLTETERKFAADGQVREVIERETVNSVTNSTKTEYTYDGRGFLLASSSRNGAGRLLTRRERSELDARGLHHQETLTGDVFPAAGVSVEIAYDALGRVLEVAEPGVSGRKWKQFTYGDENGPSDLSGRVDRRRGKLVSGVRHNYFESAHYAVTSAYAYHGVGGRVSQEDLDVSTVSTSSNELRMDKSYRTTVTYDELGKVDQMGYPVCLECSSGEPASAPMLDYTRTQGYLTALSASRGNQTEPWLNSVSWSISGGPFEIVHGNFVKDIYQPDPFRRDRASSIEVRGPDGNLRYETGAILYDGTGQTCGVGNESYVRPPQELEPDAAATPACAAAQEIDPFGHFNGRITDPVCRGTMLESVNLFDIYDGLSARLLRGAVKKVTVNGVPYWVPDPLRFERVWWVRGTDGALLSEVHDSLGDGWRSTVEHYYAFGKAVGKSKREWAQPNFVRIYHLHPMTVYSTQPNGRPWPSGN